MVFSNRDDSLTLFLHQREALQRTDSKHHCIFSRWAQRCFNLSARSNSFVLQSPCNTYGTHRRVARFPPCKHPLESPPYHLLARSPYTGDRALFASTAPKNNGQTASGLCKAIQGRNLLGACWIPKDAGAWVITKRGSLKRAIHPVTTRVC